MPFDALRPNLGFETGRSIIVSSLDGHVEMNPVRGTGSDELAEDDSLEG